MGESRHLSLILWENKEEGILEVAGPRRVVAVVNVLDNIVGRFARP